MCYLLKIACGKLRQKGFIQTLWSNPINVCSKCKSVCYLKGGSVVNSKLNLFVCFFLGLFIHIVFPPWTCFLIQFLTFLFCFFSCDILTFKKVEFVYRKFTLGLWPYVQWYVSRRKLCDRHVVLRTAQAKNHAILGLFHSISPFLSFSFL